MWWFRLFIGVPDPRSPRQSSAEPPSADPPPQDPPPVRPPLRGNPSAGPSSTDPLPGTPAPDLPPPDSPPPDPLRRTASNFALFSLSGGRLVEFWWCLKRRDPQMCTFGLPGCRVTFDCPSASNTTKIQREDPQRETKRAKMVAGEGKKREMLGPSHHSTPHFLPHPSAPPFGLHLSGPHPSAPTFSGFGPPTLRYSHPSGGPHPSGPHPSGPHRPGPPPTRATAPF